MAQVAPLLLVLWVPLVVFLFPLFSRHRAVIFSFLTGLMFLPVVGLGADRVGSVDPISLTPLHFTKHNSITYALLAAVLCYDFKRVLTFRPTWLDLPMILWCCCPIASSLTNEPPPDGSPAFRDALSQSLQVVVEWGVPYLLGRLYLTDRKAWRDLCLGMGLAAVVYAPLCLLEVRFSPQFHKIVYGYMQHSFVQTIRFDGYRPMVFFEHGLTLSFWMVNALLMTAWLWCTDDPIRSEDSRPDVRSRLLWFLFILMPTVVLLKSSGALALGLLGGCTLLLTRWWPSRLGLLVLVAVPILYLTLRTSGVWKGHEVVAFLERNFSAERAQSLAFRLDNEELLRDRALVQPWFGWGGWGRGRVYDEGGNDRTVTDGRWILALGDRGLVGLLALFAALLLPPLRFAFLFPPRRWSEPAMAPVAAAAVALLLFSIDSLLNAGSGDLFAFMAGGLIGINPKLFGGREAALCDGVARLRSRLPSPAFSAALERT